MISSHFVSSDLSSAIAASDLSIYTNYVGMHLSINKLDNTNYIIWTLNVKLWLKSQEYVDHITQKRTSTDSAEDIFNIFT